MIGPDKKLKLKSAQRFLTISEPKLLNLRPMFFVNFSLRNLFANGQLDFQPFVNWGNKTFKKRKRLLAQRVCASKRILAQTFGNGTPLSSLCFSFAYPLCL